MVSHYCDWFGIKHYKIHWVVEFVNLNQTSSIVPFGILMDLLDRDKVIVVGFSSPSQAAGTWKKVVG